MIGVVGVCECVLLWSPLSQAIPLSRGLLLSQVKEGLLELSLLPPQLLSQYLGRSVHLLDVATLGLDHVLPDLDGRHPDVNTHTHTHTHRL